MVEFALERPAHGTLRLTDIPRYHRITRIKTLRANKNTNIAEINLPAIGEKERQRSQRSKTNDESVLEAAGRIRTSGGDIFEL